ncbi:hypothetical protein Emed_007465 [Eimeria media]
MAALRPRAAATPPLQRTRRTQRRLLTSKDKIDSEQKIQIAPFLCSRGPPGAPSWGGPHHGRLVVSRAPKAAACRRGSPDPLTFNLLLGPMLQGKGSGIVWAWRSPPAHFPRAASVLGQQLLLLFHALSLLMLARQPYPDLQGTNPEAPLGIHAQQEVPHLQQPPGPPPPNAPGGPRLHGGAPGPPFPEPEREAGPLASAHSAGTPHAPTSPPHHPPPPASAADTHRRENRSEERRRGPESSKQPPAPPPPQGPPTRPRDAGEGGGAGKAQGQASGASAEAAFRSVGLLLLAGGWSVAALLLLCPLGCLPYLRLCRATSHNRAGVGERSPAVGAPPPEQVVFEGPPHVLSRPDNCWGPPRRHGVYVPSLINEVLPQCALAMAGAPLVALLAWGEYGALSSLAGRWGPPASMLAKAGFGARLGSWAAVCPPWQLSLFCVAAVVLGFGVLTAYPVSSFFLWGSIAGASGALGALCLPGAHALHAATGGASLLKALPRPLLSGAAAACLAAGICSFHQSTRVRGALAKPEVLLLGVRALCCLVACLMLLCCSRPLPPRSSHAGWDTLFGGWLYYPDDATASVIVVWAFVLSLLASLGLCFCAALWGPPHARKDICFCQGFEAPFEQELEQQQSLRYVGEARVIQLSSTDSVDKEERRCSSSSSCSSSTDVFRRVSLPGEALEPPEGPLGPRGGPWSHAASVVMEGLRRVSRTCTRNRGP